MNEEPVKVQCIPNDGKSYYSIEKNTNGVRASTHKNTEEIVKQWHRAHAPRKAYAADIDLVEYRYRDGKLQVVALLELKRCVNAYGENSSEQVETRVNEYRSKPAQLELIQTMARALHCPAYLVLYTLDMQCSYVIDMFTWNVVCYSEERFVNFIEGL